MLAPALKTRACYYKKSKLCSHNYTIYDKKNKEATCYLWNETEGDLTSNTFSSFLLDYFSNNERCLDADTIIIYTDGCTYQNRCVQFSNALLYYSKSSKKCIVKKILCKGHTQMEVDGVHAQIERSIRNKTVYAPSTYVTLIENAKKTKPYCFEVFVCYYIK